jgi:hypothetical protein
MPNKGVQIILSITLFVPRPCRLSITIFQIIIFINGHEKYVISLILIAGIYFLFANENLRAQTVAGDTIRFFYDSAEFLRGESISEADFNLQINKFIDVMEKGNTVKTIDDYMVLVRLQNTVAYEGLFCRKEVYRHFLNLFESKYLKPTVYKLEAHVSRGGGYYSSKYKIGIGGPPPANGDFYHIIRK